MVNEIKLVFSEITKLQGKKKTRIHGVNYKL